MTSTQIVFFDDVHIQQVSGPPMTSKLNEVNIRFPRDEEGNIDVKKGKYDTNNQPKKATFKAKIKSKNGMITGKRCPVSDYSGEKIVTIDAYKK